MVFSRLLWVVEVGVPSFPFVPSMTDKNRMPQFSRIHHIHHINHIISFISIISDQILIHKSMLFRLCWSIWICLEKRWTLISNGQGWCAKGNPSISRLTFFKETTISNRSNWFIAFGFWYFHSNDPSKEKAFWTNPKTIQNVFQLKPFCVRL